MLNPESVVARETAEMLVQEFHCIPHFTESRSEMPIRPPVVTIMGHVDHGKTTLLDQLRSSNITSTEHGGITQRIGGFSMKTKTGEKFTFLDTPGHEAFSKMRQRGASVTDLVILLVCAKDGLQPQTIESIKHAKAADVPIIVAYNKIDLPSADVEGVQTELIDYLDLEAFGGETFGVPISAVKGTNIDQLLETINFKVELMDLREEVNCPGAGTIIESKLGRVGGTCAAIVQRGTLRPGDHVVAGKVNGRVRGLVDDYGKKVKSAQPSDAVEIIGLKDLPEAGDDLLVVDNQFIARKMSMRREARSKVDEAAKIKNTIITLPKLKFKERSALRRRDTDEIINRMKEEAAREPEDIPVLKRGKGGAKKSKMGKFDIDYAKFDKKSGDKKTTEERIADVEQIFTNKETNLPGVIIKTSDKGMLESIQHSIERLQSKSKVDLDIISAEVGLLTADDVLCAETFGAAIFTMDLDVSGAVLRDANKSDVVIRSHKIIYHMLEDIENLLHDHRSEEQRSTNLGQARVNQTFKMGGKTVGGVTITKGKVQSNSFIRVKRDGEVIRSGVAIDSLRVKKDSVKEVRNGEDCGIALGNLKNLEVGDILEIYSLEAETSLFENRTKIVTAEDVKDK